GRSLLEDASAILPVRHLGVHYRALHQGLVAPLAPLMPVPVHSFPGTSRTAAVREHVAQGGIAEQVRAAVSLAVEHARAHPHDSLLLVTDDDAGSEDVGIALRAAVGRSEHADQLRAALGDAADQVEPFLVRPVRRISGEVRDRVIWVTAPGGAPDARAVGSVLAAARRAVDVVVPTSVGEWAPGAGGGVSLLQRALVQEEPEHGHGSAVLGELVRRLRAE